MERLKIHIKTWKIWNKSCMNRPFYKFLVLIGLVKSPTFDMLKGHEEELEKTWQKFLKKRSL